MRKGQGISINVIVIAALALIILVILSTIVIQKIGKFSKDSSVCGGSTSAEYCTIPGSSCKDGEVQANKPCINSVTKEPETSRICCLRTAT